MISCCLLSTRNALDIFILLIVAFDTASYLISEITGDGILGFLSLLWRGSLPHPVSLASIHLGNTNLQGVPQGSILGTFIFIISSVLSFSLNLQDFFSRRSFSLSLTLVTSYNKLGINFLIEILMETLLSRIFTYSN